MAPFAYFFVISFWTVRLYRLVPNFTLANYARVADPTTPTSASLTLLAGAGHRAAHDRPAGFVYAYIIRFRAGRWGQLLLFIALVTLFGGYLMKIYAWKTILGNEGVLNSALLGLGLDRPAVHGAALQPGAVVVTLIHFLAAVRRSCRSTAPCAASATASSRRRATSAPGRWRVAERHPDPALPAPASSPPSSSAS